VGTPVHGRPASSGGGNRGLGWEVLLDELLPEELPESCGDCMLALGTFRIVYTRRPEEAPERGDSE
jgi:hypothetical protein